MVFFGGLPNLTPTYLIKKYFQETCGEVITLKLDNKFKTSKHHKPSLMHRGSGYVEFRSMETARFASAIGSHYLEGNYFEVRLALPKHLKKRIDKHILEEDRKVHLRTIPREASIGKSKHNLTFRVFKNDFDKIRDDREPSHHP